MGRLAAKHDPTADVPGEEPERTCAVTRVRLAPEELIRFVAGPDGTVVPDVAHRLPGRGVWITLRRDLVERAAQQNVFARSLKRQVTVPPELGQAVERLLARRVLQALSLANKAGLVVAGFTKVDIAIARGEVAVLVHAAEAARDGAAKLDRKLMAVAAELAEINAGPAKNAGPGKPEIVPGLGSAELSLALGRENVVHAALRAGGATRHFLTEAERLGRYRAVLQSDAGRPPQTRSNTEQV